MAYRFLLEVPETLADAASIAVERVDDAQVLVARPSHGLGVDDPYVDMTVAAHSLRVVDSIFDWYESMSPPRGEVRMVLHGGERHGWRTSIAAAWWRSFGVTSPGLNAAFLILATTSRSPKHLATPSDLAPRCRSIGGNRRRKHGDGVR
jgi:hypothetical protein